MARSEVLEMLEVNEDMWFGRLDDDFPKVKWMQRVYPRVDYTQAQWTVAGTVDGRWYRGRLLCLGSRAKSSTIQGRHKRFTGGSAFHTSFPGLLSLLATQQK